ncbi:MAG: radical SAM protein, partial [Acidilobaceae archaeon]
MRTSYGLAKGCELCDLGSKAVIFVTGLCPEDCFYCPISPERWRLDVTYVNEERVYSLNDIVIEVNRMSALGAGITGGEPFIVLDRVVKIITTLKEHFGESFHIHL